MYNGKAFVNTSNRKVPVYQLTENEIDITNKQIGTIYPNECFGMHNSEGNVSFIVFRNSSGGISRGGFGSVEPEYTYYCERKSNGKTLSSNTPDKNGYYRHSLAKNMNWYIGTHKQSTPLPKGTVVLLKSCTTGADYPSRIFCSGYRKPGETKDTIKEFCIDFLTVGSMPSNRAIL